MNLALWILVGTAVWFALSLPSAVLIGRFISHGSSAQVTPSSRRPATFHAAGLHRAG